MEKGLALAEFSGALISYLPTWGTFYLAFHTVNTFVPLEDSFFCSTQEN